MTRSWGLLALAISWPVSPARADELADLLGKAGEYVTAYEGRFANLTAQEDYVQSTCPRGATEGKQWRRLESDVVFVRLPGHVPWATFRDVAKVDGRPVRDREDRLVRLFTKPSDTDVQRARQILDESARFNLGRVTRNFNVPTLALAFLLPANQLRFRWDLKGARKIEGVPARELRYQEIGQPALIRDRVEDVDRPARGSFWIAADGAVLATELVLAFKNADTSIHVSFQKISPLELRAPKEMREDVLPAPGRGERRALSSEPMSFQEGSCADTGVARYDSYRKFQVDTQELFEGPVEPGPHR